MKVEEQEKVLTLESLRNSNRAVISRREAAQLLEVDPRTVSRMIASGEIPSIAAGAKLLIPREGFLKIFE